MTITDNTLKDLIRRVNCTGLSGNYDLELTYAPDVSDESGPTLARALQEQLGLQLEKGEMAVDILIVDAADRVPRRELMVQRKGRGYRVPAAEIHPKGAGPRKCNRPRP